MTQPWGDPEKIAYAMSYASELTNHISSLSELEKNEFLKIDNDPDARRKLFIYIEKKIKSDGYKGSGGTDDLAYLISVVVESLFPNNHTEITRKFFRDGLFKSL